MTQAQQLQSTTTSIQLEMLYVLNHPQQHTAVHGGYIFLQDDSSIETSGFDVADGAAHYERPLTGRSARGSQIEQGKASSGVIQ